MKQFVENRQDINTNVSLLSGATEETLSGAEPTMEELQRSLRQIASTGPPRVGRLASWLAEQPEEIAFNSVRGLARRSGANANTVVRLARALGFSGYETCRNVFQDALRHSPEIYGRRAGELQRKHRGAVLEAVREAAHLNLESVFSPAGQKSIGEAAGLLLEARQVHVVGVRSCNAIADYLGYTAAMAFGNFGPRASMPGDIRDRVASSEPGDVVVSITFPHYSVETIAAHEIALRRGARTIAVTDGVQSPIAVGADLVLTPEMHGPQPLPSMLAAFAMVESIVTAMVARSEDARRNIARFEQRLIESGAYRLY